MATAVQELVRAVIDAEYRLTGLTDGRDVDHCEAMCTALWKQVAALDRVDFDDFHRTLEVRLHECGLPYLFG